MRSPLQLSALLAALLTAVPALAENKLFIEPATATVGDTDVSLPILLDNDQPLYGFSLSIVVEMSQLKLTGVNTTGTDFEDADFADGLVMDDGAGITWGLVLDTSDPFDVDNVIPVGAGVHIANVTLDVTATVEGVASVEFEDVPSDNPQTTAPAKNVLVGNLGTPIPFTVEAGEVTISEDTPTTVFVRGDSNGDSKIDISDGVYHLNFLFLGGPDPLCMDASDMDDNGKLEITDAIYLLSALFQGGPNPPEPYPVAGVDPTDDDPLGCVQGTAAP